MIKLLLNKQAKSLPSQVHSAFSCSSSSLAAAAVAVAAVAAAAVAAAFHIVVA